MIDMMKLYCSGVVACKKWQPIAFTPEAVRSTRGLQFTCVKYFTSNVM